MIILKCMIENVDTRRSGYMNLKGQLIHLATHKYRIQLQLDNFYSCDKDVNLF